MDQKDEKCVVIMDRDLPIGVMVNTATILGITLGNYLTHHIGENVFDQSNREHAGIISIPVPVLEGDEIKQQQIREMLAQPRFEACKVVDFTDIAQSCLNYADYIEKMSNVKSEELHYFGLALYGPKKLINKLTGDLPLLR